jgi:hypothetical protein
MTEYGGSVVLSIQKIVKNPNLVVDMIEYLKLQMAEEGLQKILDGMEQSDPEDYHRLNVFMDRVEFIEHLNSIVDLLASLTEPFTWVDQDSVRKEVRGVENDIESLRLYLALTCVDIYSDKASGVTDRFRRAFDNAPSEVINELQNHLRVDGSTDLSSIVEALYSIRNSYTHDGLRFHHMSNLPVHQSHQVFIGRGHSQSTLDIAPRFDLIQAVLKVAIANARKVLADFSIQ